MFVYLEIKREREKSNLSATLFSILNFYLVHEKNAKRNKRATKKTGNLGTFKINMDKTKDYMKSRHREIEFVIGHWVFVIE